MEQIRPYCVLGVQYSTGKRAVWQAQQHVRYECVSYLRAPESSDGGQSFFSLCFGIKKAKPNSDVMACTGSTALQLSACSKASNSSGHHGEVHRQETG